MSGFLQSSEMLTIPAILRRIGKGMDDLNQHLMDNGYLRHPIVAPANAWNGTGMHKHRISQVESHDGRLT